MKAAFAFLVALASCVLVASKFHVMQKSVPRHDFVKLAESSKDALHELVFAVQQKNLKEFDEILLDRSTPGSRNYQKWLTFEEVGKLTSNPEGATEVQKWLQENDIPVTWQSAHGDYIKATAPISKWESLLDTKFYEWEDHSRKTLDKSKRTMHRAEVYSLPETVKPHLSAVFNTVQVPPVFKPQYHRALNGGERESFKTTMTVTPVKDGSNLRKDNNKKTLANGVVTVPFLNEFYEITTNDGDPSMSQSVFETVEESFSPTDLTLFQQNYSLPIQACEAPYGFSTDDCITNDCGEGNLDVQYIMGVAQRTATIYWYVTENSTTDPFVAWLTDIADMENPPLVNSMSWGSVEQGNSVDVMSAFNTEAMKLTSMGVTVTISSGDNGAPGDEHYCNFPSGSGVYDTGWTGASWTGRGYFPSFPATSPYVTTVGATMGPEVGDPEIASQSQLGAVITTGGGFSTYNPTPPWQKAAVNAYFAGLPSDQVPTSGYNPNGRAYPDVSMIGVWYQVFIQGELESLFGTSASSPVFAALVTLTNSARAAQNKPPLGFLNPSIYAYGSTNAYFNDITSGNNKCTAWGDISNPSGATCCNSGFYASPGWDPVTGFGSIQYENLNKMIENAPEHDDGVYYSDDDSSSNGLSKGAIAGIVIGCVAGVALIGAAIFFFMSGTFSAGAGSAAAAAGTGTAVANPVVARAV